MDLIVSRDNILLAYRNIKANKGSYTAGTDKKNITDIGSRTPDDVVKRVRFIVTGSEHGVQTKACITTERISRNPKRKNNVRWESHA